MTLAFGSRAMARTCLIPGRKWDRAVEEWKAARRAEFERKKLLGQIRMPAANKIKECSTLVPEHHSDMADVGNSGSQQTL